MSHDPSTMPPSAAPLPWGFVGSIAWGVLGLAAFFLGQFLALSIFLSTRNRAIPIDAEVLKRDGFLLALVTIVAVPGWIAVSALAARQRGWSARGYLALIPPRRGEIMFAIGCLAALLVALDLVSYAVGRDVVPRFMIDAYISARSSGSLVLFFVAIIIVAPMGEEIAFRGFLFRGLSASFLGVAGTIVTTSALWAVMHIQYDAYTVGQIMLIGLLLGWLRWATGSTVLAIGLHALANLAACVQAAIVVAWTG
jgi:membrane protease YdiL (CAAX protease family)